MLDNAELVGQNNGLLCSAGYQQTEHGNAQFHSITLLHNRRRILQQRIVGVFDLLSLILTGTVATQGSNDW